MWWTFGALVLAVIAVWVMTISYAVAKGREQVERAKDGDADPFEP